MTQKNYHTSEMKPAEKTEKAAPEQKPKRPKQSFHFAGSGAYSPLTIQAYTREEAEREWKERRKRLQ